VTSESRQEAIELNDRFLLLALNATVTWENPAGWAAGTKLTTLIHPSDQRLLEEALEQVAANPVVRRVLDCRITNGSGGWRPSRIDVGSAPGGSGSGFLAVLRPVHPDADSSAELLRRATEDSLTGLSNRATLLSRLRAAETAGDGDGLTIIYIDTDHFKQVNDRLGHAAGDKVLLAVADRLRSAVRPGDLVARIGGDEFVVVAGGVADLETAAHIAERIRTCMAPAIRAGGRSVTQTVSIGVSVGPGRIASTLLEQADIALYRAKNGGRNRVELYRGADEEEGSRRHGWFDPEAVLRKALDRDVLRVVYQPVVDLVTGRTLMRRASLISDTDGRRHSPEALLRIAEESGLAVSLGAGLVDQASTEAASWASDLVETPAPDLLLPMSPRQLDEPRAAEAVVRTLQGSGLPATRLWIEIPERALVQPSDRSLETLQLLRQAGIRIVISDFGSGLASLAVLRDATIDGLVLDAGFMEGLGQDPRSILVVEGVVALARTFGVKVKAPGVKDSAQAELLRAIGCDCAWGPYFGPPMLAGELALAGSAN
jgi:diguanylate cyclase (GGDEF)-like protein